MTGLLEPQWPAGSRGPGRDDGSPGAAEQLGRESLSAEGLHCVSKAGDARLGGRGGVGQLLGPGPAEPLHNTGAPSSLAYLRCTSPPGSAGGDWPFLRVKSTSGARRGGG